MLSIHLGLGLEAQVTLSKTHYSKHVLCTDEESQEFHEVFEELLYSMGSRARDNFRKTSPSEDELVLKNYTAGEKIIHREGESVDIKK